MGVCTVLVDNRKELKTEQLHKPRETIDFYRFRMEGMIYEKKYNERICIGNYQFNK